MGIMILLPPFSFCVADDSTTAIDVTSPSVPVGLSPTVISQNEIRLDWSAVSGVAGYRVYRGGALIASPLSNTYSDTGLSVKTTYSYTVSSVNAFGGESVQSSSVSATTFSGMSGGLGSPSPPSGGFQISINDGAKHVDNNIVTLELAGGLDANSMIISNFPDFRDVYTQEPYVATKEWDLCKGLTSCPEGEYSVYVKFCFLGKQASETVSYNISYYKPEAESIFEQIKAAINEFSSKITDLRKWIVQLAQKPVKTSEESEEGGALVGEAFNVLEKQGPAEKGSQEEAPSEESGEKETQSKKPSEEKPKTGAENLSFFDFLKNKTLLFSILIILLITGLFCL